MGALRPLKIGEHPEERQICANHLSSPVCADLARAVSFSQGSAVRVEEGFSGVWFNKRNVWDFGGVSELGV